MFNKSKKNPFAVLSKVLAFADRDLPKLYAEGLAKLKSQIVALQTTVADAQGRMTESNLTHDKKKAEAEARYQETVKAAGLARTAAIEAADKEFDTANADSIKTIEAAQTLLNQLNALLADAADISFEN